MHIMMTAMVKISMTVMMVIIMTSVLFGIGCCAGRASTGGAEAEQQPWHPAAQAPAQTTTSLLHPPGTLSPKR